MRYWIVRVLFLEPHYPYVYSYTCKFLHPNKTQFQKSFLNSPSPPPFSGLAYRRCRICDFVFHHRVKICSNTSPHSTRTISQIYEYCTFLVHRLEYRKITFLWVGCLNPASVPKRRRYLPYRVERGQPVRN